MAGFQNYFKVLFHSCPLTEMAQMVPLHLTRWPPELKIEKKKIFERHLQWLDSKYNFIETVLL